MVSLAISKASSVVLKVVTANTGPKNLFFLENTHLLCPLNNVGWDVHPPL